ncbi:hypothetical protein SRHO_G00027220 [Serrasalmus rhombeus]
MTAGAEVTPHHHQLTALGRAPQKRSARRRWLAGRVTSRALGCAALVERLADRTLSEPPLWRNPRGRKKGLTDRKTDDAKVKTILKLTGGTSTMSSDRAQTAAATCYCKRRSRLEERVSFPRVS